jgi:hypothetical protein
MKSRKPVKQISHIIRVYSRGIICPSEMWMLIADVLTPTIAVAILNSLPQESKDHLLRVWLEYPPAVYIHRSAEVPGNREFQSTCARIVRWCELIAPPADDSTQTPGIIRVRDVGE